MADFGYVLDRIWAAPFVQAPFRHIYIDNLFSAAHFEQITRAPEINIGGLRDDEELFERLVGVGFVIIKFPGCVTDQRQYLSWRARRDHHADIHSACEGFGVTLRLATPRSEIVSAVSEFLSGSAFNNCIAEKFGVSLGDTTVDSGIQKYLDGYEISPHPDIRCKALTYMVNINPHEGAATADHHTRYLMFKKPYRYVQSFWEGNPDVDRCWVPWSWCDVQFVQNQNNSIILFAPSNDTLHGVKAAYDHLQGQRTQLYGNLWYKQDVSRMRLEWEDLDLRGRCRTR